MIPEWVLAAKTRICLYYKGIRHIVKSFEQKCDIGLYRNSRLLEEQFC